MRSRPGHQKWAYAKAIITSPPAKRVEQLELILRMVELHMQRYEALAALRSDEALAVTILVGPCVVKDIG